MHWGIEIAEQLSPSCLSELREHHRNMYHSSPCTKTPLTILSKWWEQSRNWCPKLLDMIIGSYWKSAPETRWHELLSGAHIHSATLFDGAHIGASTHTNYFSVIVPLWNGKVIPGKSFWLGPRASEVWQRSIYGAQRMVKSYSGLFGRTDLDMSLGSKFSKEPLWLWTPGEGMMMS